MKSLMSEERKSFHHYLTDKRILTIENGVASNADKSSKLSKSIAGIIADTLGATEHTKIEGQTAGANFESACLYNPEWS